MFYNFKAGQVDLREVMSSIELITQSGQLQVRGADLFSTLYACEDATNASDSTDYQLYRHVRQLYAAMPLSLKALCRNTIRACLLPPTPPQHAPLDTDDNAEPAETAVLERLVFSAAAAADYDDVDDATRHSIVNFLTFSEFDFK